MITVSQTDVNINKKKIKFIPYRKLLFHHLISSQVEIRKPEWKMMQKILAYHFTFEPKTLNRPLKPKVS